jgi:hypothetical protein
MMFVPHRAHTYGPPRPITGIALFFIYVDNVGTSQDTQVRLPTAYYWDSFTILYADDVITSEKTFMGPHSLLRV